MKILVIGDAILDHYVYGHINRMSPEDISVPILDFQREGYRLGGCLNTAANVKSLNPDCSVSVSSIVSYVCAPMLEKRNINCSSFCYFKEDAIKKTRLVDVKRNKQLLRLDNKEMFDYNTLEFYQRKVVDSIDFNKFDCVVVSDYVKGVVSEPLISKLEGFKGTIFVDTKDPYFPIRWSVLSKLVVFKINYHEWSNVEWRADDNLFVVVTDGERGAHLWNGQKFVRHWPTTIVSNVEVTGAGDVFLAGLAVDYMKNKELYKAIEFAIAASTESVRHKGTTEVRLEWLKNRI